jgi:hypothetical protein
VAATITTRRPALEVERLLRWAAAAFTAAVLLHNGDHLRRGGDSVTADVFVAGTLAMVVEVGVVLLVHQRHRWAPAAAVAAGFPLAAGYVATHLLPGRSWLSDPLLDGGAAGISQAAAAVEIAAALALGVAGAIAMRQPWPGGARPLSEAMRHPVVLAMLVGNVVILVGSLSTR